MNIVAWMIFELIALPLLWVVVYPVLLIVYTPFALIISMVGPGRYSDRAVERFRNFHRWYRKFEKQCGF